MRHVTRNVTRRRDGTMIRRWVGLGLQRAAARFRRIKGHRELAALATALRQSAASEAAVKHPRGLVLSLQRRGGSVWLRGARNVRP